MPKGDFQHKMDGFQDKLLAWSRGRNGADDTSTIVMNLAILLVIIDLFVRTTWLALLACILIVYSWWRISSKQVAHRHQENEQVLKLLGPAAAWIINPISAFRETKRYKHLVCPSCGQRIRIPRGKGKIRITCPKCHTRFDGKA